MPRASAPQGSRVAWTGATCRATGSRRCGAAAPCAMAAPRGGSTQSVRGSCVEPPSQEPTGFDKGAAVGPPWSKEGTTPLVLLSAAGKVPASPGTAGVGLSQPPSLGRFSPSSSRSILPSCVSHVSRLRAALRHRLRLRLRLLLRTRLLLRRRLRLWFRLLLRVRLLLRRRPCCSCCSRLLFISAAPSYVGRRSRSRSCLRSLSSCRSLSSGRSLSRPLSRLWSRL
mmetsp:Transcript_44511/g.127003  ORF Transcript_44511/g.127003 Transcript_44511/m.127003 type:complete len:226 (-) Transcript_44511:1286-1963(-)